MEATHLYKWYILRTVLSYWNITKRCLMYLHEKSEILYNPNTDELLNKPFELIAKCHHGNKYLLCNYRSKTKKHHKESLRATQRRTWRLAFLKITPSLWRNYHTTLSASFSVQFPDRTFSVKAISADFWAMHLKIRGDTRLRRVSSPGDCVKELAFCRKTWSSIFAEQLY